MTIDGLDLSLVRQRLTARVLALRDASATTADDRKPVVLDQSSVGRLSRIDSMQMQEMAIASERRRELDWQRVEAAIQRIDKGDFGYCVVCEEPIAIKRLEADLATPTCVQCAAKAR